MTTRVHTMKWRAMILAVAVLFAVMGGLFAKEESERETAEIQDGEAPNEVPVQIETHSLKARQDSIFASIDESFKLVKPIFEQSCFDCHGANTDFPWYHKIPGIRQFLDNHVKEGREHLDFTDGFPFGGKGEPLEQLGSIREQVEMGEMPILSYRLLHWNAWLNGAEKDSIYEWVDSSSVGLMRFYDSEHIPYKKPVSGDVDDQE